MIVKETLPNGLTLLTEAMPHVRSVAIGVWLKQGSRHESDEHSGISHFIEHMVFKGTKNRNAERIAAEVDSIGGHMDAFTAKEYAAFHLKVLDEHLPLGRLTALGLQHVLVMYAGAVAVPLIVGRALNLTPDQVAKLISADLFVCGLVTLIQALGASQWFGIRLPVMMGVTFASVAPMVSMAQSTGGTAGAGLISSKRLVMSGRLLSGPGDAVQKTCCEDPHQLPFEVGAAAMVAVRLGGPGGELGGLTDELG